MIELFKINSRTRFSNLGTYKYGGDAIVVVIDVELKTPFQQGFQVNSLHFGRGSRTRRGFDVVA